MTHFTITHIAQTALRKPMPFRFIKAKGEEFTFQKGEENFKKNIIFDNDFYLCSYLCTQEFWEAVVNAESSTNLSATPSYFKGTHYPVEYVRWDEIQIFLSTLNKLFAYGNLRFLEGNIPLGHFILPSDAQWEYAALAGQEFEFAGSNNLNDVGWYQKNSNAQTHSVGLKQPNKNGLYDMSGNVWEWCQNVYGAIEANGEAYKNKVGSSKVIRGGCFYDNSKNCSLLYRARIRIDSSNRSCSFRILFSPVSKTENGSN
jgi:formylglycine-generating enzyme